MFPDIGLQPVFLYQDLVATICFPSEVFIQISADECLQLVVYSQMCNQLFEAKYLQPTLLMCCKLCSVQSIGAEAEPVKY